MDVSISDDIAKLRTRIKEDLGLVNILINNAAALSILSLHEGSAAEVQRVFDVSLLGHIWVRYLAALLFLFEILNSN